MNENLNICFGAMTDPITKQLRKQGFKFDKEKINKFQSLWNNMFTLRIHGILSDGHFYICQKKLYNKIKSHVMKVNGIKKEKGTTCGTNLDVREKKKYKL